MFNNTSYAFEALKKKYNDFVRPIYKIKIDGNDLSEDLGLFVDGISVEQTIKNTSGSCRFTIQNGYEEKSRKFKNNITKSFILGAKVEAYIGYGQPVLLFSGFIADLSFSFTGGSPPKVTVMCLDVRALMIQGKLAAAPPEASFKNIAEKILAKYKSATETDITYPDGSDEPNLSDKNDFNYIYDFAQEKSFEFFALVDKLYLKEKLKYKTPILTLEWGVNLISFNRNYTYNKVKLIGAYAANLKDKPIEVEKEFEQPYNIKPVTDDSIQRYENVHGAKNSADLTDKFQGAANKTANKTATGTISCIGLPIITPARLITLKNLDNGFLDNKYYIEKVVHNLSGSGYITSMTITHEE